MRHRDYYERPSSWCEWLEDGEPTKEEMAERERESRFFRDQLIKMSRWWRKLPHSERAQLSDFVPPARVELPIEIIEATEHPPPTEYEYQEGQLEAFEKTKNPFKKLPDAIMK